MAANRGDTMPASIQKIWQRGGFFGFYQGLIPWAWIEAGTKGAVLLFAASEMEYGMLYAGYSPAIAGVVGGMGGGVCQAYTTMGFCTFMKTVEVTRHKEAGGSSSKSTIQVAREIFKKEGIVGINKGVNAVAIRQCTNWGSRFGLARVAEDGIRNFSFGSSTEAKSKDLGPLQKIIASSIAGALSCWNQPIEVIRVEMQSQVKTAGRPEKMTISAAAGWIYKNNGIKGFYRGVTPRIGLGIWQTICMVFGGDQNDTITNDENLNSTLNSVKNAWDSVSTTLKSDANVKGLWRKFTGDAGQRNLNPKTILTDIQSLSDIFAKDPAAAPLVQTLTTFGNQIRQLSGSSQSVAPAQMALSTIVTVARMTAIPPTGIITVAPNNSPTPLIASVTTTTTTTTINAIATTSRTSAPPALSGSSHISLNIRLVDAQAVTLLGCFQRTPALPAGINQVQAGDFNSCIQACYNARSAGCAFTYGLPLVGNAAGALQCFTVANPPAGLRPGDPLQCRQQCRGPNDNNCARTVQFLSVFRVDLAPSPTQAFVAPTENPAGSVVINQPAAKTSSAASVSNVSSANIGGSTPDTPKISGVAIGVTVGVLVLAVLFVVVFAIYYIRRNPAGSSRFNSARNQQLTVNLMETLSLRRPRRADTFGVPNAASPLPPMQEKQPPYNHNTPTPIPAEPPQFTNKARPNTPQTQGYPGFAPPPPQFNNTPRPPNAYIQPNGLPPSQLNEDFRRERASIAEGLGIRRSMYQDPQR
ncbi:hypothetical protein HK098_006457 [Nowakowskiella sp. JEL0407]|nr:hypothetical protein HK098_006457 [Nowakowskiella sp. JEL0407]